MITDAFLQDLVTCPKKSSSLKQARFSIKNRSRRCNILCSSVDGTYQFEIFLRQSTEFIEDFSVGLIWKNASSDGSTLPECILIRCQGPHDGKEELGSDLHHTFHTHTLTSTDVHEHRYKKPSKRESTDHFASFEQAIQFFEAHCHVPGLSSVSPNSNILQLTLDNYEI